MPTFTKLPAGHARGTYYRKSGAAMETYKDIGRLPESVRSTKAPVIAQAVWKYEPGKVTLVKARSATMA